MRYTIDPTWNNNVLQDGVSYLTVDDSRDAANVVNALNLLEHIKETGAEVVLPHTGAAMHAAQEGCICCWCDRRLELSADSYDHCNHCKGSFSFRKPKAVHQCPTPTTPPTAPTSSPAPAAA